jgi:predicted amidohydrolase
MSTSGAKIRVAAVQLDAVLADVEHNLAACERLVGEAAVEGAEWIVLPEFFTTAIAFDDRLAAAALPPDGAATRLLLELAARHGAVVGGSFLCRDPDGHVRNAWITATPAGLAGRHDKDVPTMWENSFYVGGDPADIGIHEVSGLDVGVAMCWELMRTGTARRLRGKVDVVLAGSGWWSVPEWRPRPLFARLERANEQRARRAAQTFGRYVGAPVIHAAHCGEVSCRMPEPPHLPYSGHLEGGASIVDAEGNRVAQRRWDEGEGIIVADVALGRAAPLSDIPDRFWLHRRGAMGAYSWHAQRGLGRRYYRRNVQSQPQGLLPDHAQVRGGLR